MNHFNAPLDAVRRLVRSFMRRVTMGLNAITGGHLHPNFVTVTGLLAHIPIAWLIATGRNNIWAAVLLIVFGLFDTVDGELARLQNRASSIGMLLDSVTDRMKEIILYIGIAFAFVNTGHNFATVWAVAALGCSLLTSYINAWGDVVATKQQVSHHAVNKSLRGGLMSFEVRISALIIALFSGQLVIITAIIATLSFYTALERLARVSKQLLSV